MLSLEKIAYMPLDTTFPTISLETLGALFDKYGSTNYTNFWRELPYLSLISDEHWKSKASKLQNWAERYNSSMDVKGSYNFNMHNEFPEIFDFLSQLPFIKINCAFFFQPLGPTPLHLDLNTGILGEEPKPEQKKLEPLLYKVMISDQPQQTFFISPNHFNIPNDISSANGDTITHIYPQFPKLQQPFVINESAWHHGADYVPGLKKYVFLIFGILDSNRHTELLQKSFTKYKELAITLKDDTDLSQYKTKVLDKKQVILQHKTLIQKIQYNE